MTETELTDRLREAIVLDGPDVWRSNGYLQDAQQAGLPLADALKRANEISQEVANNNLLFQNIQARIARLAQPSRSQFIEQDLNQIVNAATSLKLSPDFVRNKWVPTVLQRLAAASKPEPAEPVSTPAPSIVSEPVDQVDTYEQLIEREPEPPKPAVSTPEPAKPVEPVIERAVPVSSPTPVSPVIDRPVVPPSPPEPPPIVRSFTATPARIKKGQAVTLAWEVENLLAVTIDDLGEGLSPSNRGWVKPLKTTDYTLFDANDNPLSTVRVEVIKPDRSGVYGVLFALALLAAIYWFIKSNNTPEPEREPKSKTEQPTKSSKKKRGMKTTSVRRQDPEPTPDVATTSEATATPTEAASEPIATLPDVKKKELTTSKPAEEPLGPEEPVTKPANPTDARQGKYVEAFGNKPYDKVEVGPDEQGWRRARSHGRWGYVNEFDEWVIRPEFEAVTPFRGNTAAVFINGQLITINRLGEQVRN
ncbi:WG repeat-containing protein [Spirosoma jeollabukense]